MPTLQKFKLLASQCTISASPTQSPTTSPVFHLRRRHHHHPRRRRRTLRMLLSRSAENIPDPLEDPPENRVRRKLKDLFVSSPSPPPPLDNERNSPDGGGGGGVHAVSDGVGMLPANGSVSSGNGLGGRRVGSLRPVSATFRYRLLRRAWRPVLISIPE